VVRERLYRSRDDRVLFGVAGGMADWLDLDPAIVRLVWAVLVLFGGAGLILYIIAAIVIPEEPFDYVPAAAAMGGAAASAMPGAAPAADAAAGTAAGGRSGAVPPVSPWVAGMDARTARRAARAARRAERGNTGGIIFGLILVLVGVWFLARDFLPFLDDKLVGPGILIVIGALLVVAALRRPSPPPAA
jgi:phage shock protein C